MAGTLTAKQLHEQYADLLSQPPFSEATSAYLLHLALTSRQPPIQVSHGAVKQWWKTYKVAAGAGALKSAQELEDKYGDSIRPLVVDNPTAYKFCQALRKREPPIFVTDGVAKQWLQKFAQMQYVENVGHLEIRLGKRIRDDFPQEELSADTLSAWLVREHSVSVHVKVCQTWISRSWCSDCGLCTPEAVEELCWHVGVSYVLEVVRIAWYCADFWWPSLSH